MAWRGGDTDGECDGLRVFPGDGDSDPELSGTVLGFFAGAGDDFLAEWRSSEPFLCGDALLLSLTVRVLLGGDSSLFLTLSSLAGEAAARLSLR